MFAFLLYARVRNTQGSYEIAGGPLVEKLANAWWIFVCSHHAVLINVFALLIACRETTRKIDNLIKIPNSELSEIKFPYLLN